MQNQRGSVTRPSDREFALKRKIKDLEDKLTHAELEIKQLRKKLEKEETTPKKKVGKKVVKACPKCGEEIKESVLPFGKLKLCSKGCGYRETVK